MTKKEGQTLVVEETQSEQRFDLKEFFDFNGPVVSVGYNGAKPDDNKVLQRQREADSPLKFVQGGYERILSTGGDKVIAWSDVEAKFITNNNGEEIVQSIGPTNIF